MWYCKYGEKLINKRLEDIDDDRLKVEAYRIGTPIKLSAHMVEQLEADQLYMGPGNPDPAGHGQCGDPDDLPELILFRTTIAEPNRQGTILKSCKKK